MEIRAENFNLDRSASEKHLDSLKPFRFLELEDNFLFFAAHDDKEKRKTHKPRELFGTLEQKWLELVALNEKGYGIFVTVNETRGDRRKKEDIVRIRAHFREDDEGGLRALPCEPHLILESSPGKQHEYILVDDAYPVSEFESIQQRLVDDYGSDPNAKDRSRVLRLAGTYNCKPHLKEPHLVRIVKVSDFSPYTFEEISRYFPPVVGKAKGKMSEQQFNGASELQEVLLDVACALLCIDPKDDKFVTYEVWLKVGMALHRACCGGDDGLAVFKWWSQLDRARYDESAIESKWDSFSNKDDGVTLNTIFSWARSKGYEKPDLSCADKYSDEDKQKAKRFLVEVANRQRDAMLKNFNQTHGLVPVGVHNFIVTRQKDHSRSKKHTCWKTQYTSSKAAAELNENKFIPCIKQNQSGKVELKFEPIFKAWQKWEHRRTYSDQALMPEANMIAGGSVDGVLGGLPEGGIYNLYHGLNIIPKAGDCGLILAHIKDVWCSGCEESYSYVVGWLARLFQHPGEQGHTAIVLKSGQGTGKNTIVDILTAAFGSNAKICSSQNDLVGQFNAQAASSVLLFANEAVWGGDRKTEGSLKTLITDDTLSANEKHIPSFAVRNCTHLILCTNNDWAVPVDIDDRRFFFPNVSDRRKGDSDYFVKLHAHIENGGDAAFIDYLLKCDISNFDVRIIPDNNSATKLEHKLSTADSAIQWIYECVSNEQIISTASEPCTLLNSEGWCGTDEHSLKKRIIGTADIQDAYKSWCFKERKHQQNIETFGRKLKELGVQKKRPNKSGNRTNCYDFPHLDDVKRTLQLKLGRSPSD